jgi:hypothetical protein
MKIGTVVGTVILLSGIVSGVWIVDARYASSSDVTLLAQRLDRKILRDDIRSLGFDMRQIEYEHGKEKAQQRNDWKKLEEERDLLREELKKN